jgi:DNA-binding GntR family transcriptional regulator
MSHTEGIFKMNNKVPDEVLKEIFPKKLKRSSVSEQVYSYVKSMILSGKLKKGQRLLRWKFAQIFDVNETVVSEAFCKLKKDGLIISKGNKKLFVV